MRMKDASGVNATKIKIELETRIIRLLLTGTCQEEANKL